MRNQRGVRVRPQLVDGGLQRVPGVVLTGQAFLPPEGRLRQVDQFAGPFAFGCPGEFAQCAGVPPGGATIARPPSTAPALTPEPTMKATGRVRSVSSDLNR